MSSEEFGGVLGEVGHDKIGACAADAQERFNHGAVARSYSARGGASFHGGAHFEARSFQGGGGRR